MFYLHASNKTENLLRHLAGLLEAAPLESLFEKEYILIQSQGMERMISQYMAEYFTSWCNYRFLLPVTFLQDIADKLGMAITPDSYERNFLRWRIEEKLRSIESDVYAPLQHYLQGEQAELKRFQLAGQLANIFDQYQLLRPRMLISWEQQKPCLNHKAELWQMDLWNRLVAEKWAGCHRGELLHDVTRALYEGDTVDSLPRRVSVFGVHILPPFFLDYLGGLAKHCDVHLFLLSPCRNYWGDMNRRNNPALPMEGQAHHPLLASLGKQGRDFQNLLLEKMEIESEFASYEEPAQAGKATLLHRLQSDLLAGSLKDSEIGAGADGSIRIVSCHSRQRELDVLKDHILRMLDDDEELQLRDIVVMTPDIQEYAPFIPAVFEDIQHSIADRSLRRRNGYIAAFLEFFAMLNGRFGWSEVVDLLEKEQIHPNFGLSHNDFEHLQHWIVSAGIRWGISTQSRAAEGLDFSENSWQEGLARLLMGYAVDSDSEVAGILPYTDIEGGEAKPLGGLCRFIHLLERASTDLNRARELREWSGLLLDYSEKLFGAGDDRDFLELQETLRQLGECGLFHQGTVGVEVITKWFEQSSKESRSASGFLKGHLTFCSMLPMRSIPFTAVCLIGMNYGIFPGSDGHSTFDLMKAEPHMGDRSLRADDRYQFLEVLLAARESLYISYIGQSLHTNDTLPPSVVVTELLEVLDTHYQAKDLEEKHPLHGFSPKYFAEKSRLFSYSEEDYLVACKKGKQRELSPWWSGSIATEQEHIALADLLRFYAHPQLFFIEQCLGFRPGEERTVPEESEAFELDGLQSYLVNQLILQEMLEEKEEVQLKKRLSLDGLWPLGVPGDILFEERKKDLQHFAACIKEENMGRPLPDLEIDLAIGDYRVTGSLTNRFEGGFLFARYADLRGKDILRAWLHHLLGAACGATVSTTKIVMKDSRISFGGDGLGEPGLEELVEVFIEGGRKPAKLLLEPGLCYCRQKMSSKARISPIQKAGNFLRNCLDNGYEPAWTLLYRNLTVEQILDDEFVGLTEQVLMPLWSKCNGC